MPTQFSREQAQNVQKQMQSVYPEVVKELQRLPGVQKVGIGVKEVGKKSTGQLAFRVYVLVKKSLDEIPPADRVPATIHGFPTDVVVLRPDVPEEDDEKYRPLKAGIQINPAGSGYGTLGFFATLLAQDEVVIVSNHHVLYGKTGKDGSEVGQPDYNDSCCCTCGDIAVNVHGIARGHLDCAIARLKDDIAFEEEVEEIGFITGVADAVSSEQVMKRGRTTGLTHGEITNITFDSTGTKIEEIEVKTDDGEERFSRPGDSGSALLNIRHEIIGLHKSGNNTDDVEPGDFHSTSVGIKEVLDAFKADGFEIEVMIGEDDDERLARRLPARGLSDALWTLELRLNKTERGRRVWQTLRRHQKEVLHLVNHHRAVTVAWQRHKGPVFLAALGRSLKEPSYVIPPEIEGMRRELAAASVLQALERHGSDVLRADLAVWAPVVLPSLQAAETVEAMVRDWESATTVTPPASEPASRETAPA